MAQSVLASDNTNEIKNINNNTTTNNNNNNSNNMKGIFFILQREGCQQKCVCWWGQLLARNKIGARGY